MRSRFKWILSGCFAMAALMASPMRANAAIELSALLPIRAIYTNPQGGFLLILEASNPACGSSGNQFNVFVGQVGMTADGAKSALAAVLTAYAVGKPVRVYFDPAIVGCPIQQVALMP